MTTMHKRCSMPRGDPPCHRQPRALCAPSPISTEHCNYVRSCLHRIDRLLLRPLWRWALTSCKACSAYISASHAPQPLARVASGSPCHKNTFRLKRACATAQDSERALYAGMTPSCFFCAEKMLVDAMSACRV